MNVQKKTKVTTDSMQIYDCFTYLVPKIANTYNIKQMKDKNGHSHQNRYIVELEQGTSAPELEQGTSAPETPR